MNYHSSRLTRVLTLLLVASFWLWPASTLAAFFASHPVVEVSEGIKDDAYLAGERVIVREAIQDDAFLAGGTVEVTNTIGEDLFAAGNVVTVSANIQDDAFLAGDMVTLENATVGDLFAVGRFIELQSATRVAGDTHLAGAKIIINGTVTGDVLVASESVEIGRAARITGDLIVYGATPAQIAEGATITGTVRQVTTSQQDRDSGRTAIATWVRLVLTFFIVSLVCLYLLPTLSKTAVAAAPTAGLMSFVWGLVWIILIIPVVLALLLTMIGWPLALAVGFFSAFVFSVSLCLLPLVVGALIHRRWIKPAVDAPLQWQHALLGSVVVVTLMWIPLIGPLLLAVFMFIMVGVLLRTFKQYV